ncbi:MAG: AarF/ABC1/UbiB kinase family protein [Desulfobacterales bacterium]|jgi:predicted unusual protein kinase regulating ubiquinone biosynthesis (AarF/ABC1/UbiB family)|nr:AarF/ABC1/UbiB kinase family protein [Desulfobacterales bacterium]
MIDAIYKDFPSAVSLGFNAARRIRQTALALGKTGLEWFTGREPSPPVLMRNAFERMGATYIKVGQLIASSPTLFPEAYVKEFQRCLDSTEPVAFAKMEKILKQELGRRHLQDLFSDIDPIPLASASIAQVYAARLYTGEDVVIKVQRPGVQDILTTDLNLLVLAATVFEKLVPRLQHASLSGILSEIRRTVMEECDFVKEAENIKIFSEFLKKTGNTKVVTPQVHPIASSRRVLTMERFYGIPLTDREQFLKSTDDPQKILGPAFQTWVQSISECELFHADLHAGNLMILEDGRVGFIDFGIVGRISEKTKEGVNSLVRAMMTNDFELMADSMLAIGMTKKEVDTDRLSEDLKSLYRAGESMETYGAGFSPDDFPEPDQFLLEIMRVAESHGIRFPREFTLLIKQFLYFDTYRDILFDLDDYMEELMSGLEEFEDDETGWQE